MPIARFSLDSFLTACQRFGGQIEKNSCKLRIEGYDVILSVIAEKDVKLDVFDKKDNLITTMLMTQLTDIMYDTDAISFFNPEDNLTISKTAPFIDTELI